MILIQFRFQQCLPQFRCMQRCNRLLTSRTRREETQLIEEGQRREGTNGTSHHTRGRDSEEMGRGWSSSSIRSSVSGAAYGGLHCPALHCRGELRSVGIRHTAINNNTNTRTQHTKKKIVFEHTSAQVWCWCRNCARVLYEMEMRHVCWMRGTYLSSVAPGAAMATMRCGWYGTSGCCEVELQGWCGGGAERMCESKWSE